MSDIFLSVRMVIMNTILILFYFTSFPKHLVNSGIHPDHDAYLQRHGLECGVIPPIGRSQAKSKGRIINGKLTNTIYPWMAQVQAKRADGVEYGSGSIITHKVVLTCGHCICNEKYVNCKRGVISVNIKGKNEIHVIVGEAGNHIVYDDTPYDDKIRAYLYRYEQTYPNGDVGIIINNRMTIDEFREYGPNAAPICLPQEPLSTLDRYKTNGLKAKIVGWGSRYDDRNNGPLCQTTQAVGRQPQPRFFLPEREYCP